MSKEAMKLALDWIEGNGKYDAAKRIAQTIREALAEQPAPMIRGDIRDGLVDDEPAHQHIEHCLWARNGNQPCPHVQPAQQQEPVAWALSHSRDLEFSSKYPMQKLREAAEQMARQHMGKVTVTPLYTSPPASKPLTDEQIAELMMQTWGCSSIAPRHAPAFARAIEAKLKEKNA